MPDTIVEAFKPGDRPGDVFQVIGDGEYVTQASKFRLNSLRQQA